MGQELGMALRNVITRVITPRQAYSTAYVIRNTSLR